MSRNYVWLVDFRYRAKTWQNFSYPRNMIAIWVFSENMIV